uniref:GG16501 n=1 Tax=Drosophila erecta TaxID=7220 RepID=B3NYR9_DROER
MGYFVHLLYVIKPFALCLCCLCCLCGTRAAFSRHPAAYTHAHEKFETLSTSHRPSDLKIPSAVTYFSLHALSRRGNHLWKFGTIRSISTALLFWRFNLFRFDSTRSQLTASTSSSRSCWICSTRMSPCRPERSPSPQPSVGCTYSGRSAEPTGPAARQHSNPREKRRAESHAHVLPLFVFVPIAMAGLTALMQIMLFSGWRSKTNAKKCKSHIICNLWLEIASNSLNIMIGATPVGRMKYEWGATY